MIFQTTAGIGDDMSEKTTKERVTGAGGQARNKDPHRENPDGEENQETYKQHRREVFGLQMIAAATAHRACGNQEQDAQNGKLAGYCIVCQVPWPCETAQSFIFKSEP